MDSNQKNIATDPEFQFKPEMVSIDQIKPHPKNYRMHPEDQIQHLIKSIQDHGLYRNIIVASDGTILAGHGVVQACRKMDLKQIPVIRLDLDPNDIKALKILTGDNEIGHLGEIDDRALSNILKEIKDTDLDGLLGTGYDEKMLANLIMVTRPASEIKDINAAAAWVGMPAYEPGDGHLRIIVLCDNEQEAEKFISQFKIRTIRKSKNLWSFRWPNTEQDDPSSVIIEG